MRTPRTRGQWAVLLLVLVVVGGLWLWEQRPTGPEAGPVQPDRTASTATLAPSGDSDTGLPVVELEDLPREAQETVELIDDGGPFPYDRDGVTFQNREGILPDQQRGFYREYTVPTPGEDDRGARRIVAGGEDLFWTPDHYASFAVIDR